MTTRMGRPSVFAPKDGDKKYQIQALTAQGQKLFEQARAQLAKLVEWPGRVSDSDVIDWLVRGKKRPPRS